MAKTILINLRVHGHARRPIMGDYETHDMELRNGKPWRPKVKLEKRGDNQVAVPVIKTVRVAVGRDQTPQGRLLLVTPASEVPPQWVSIEQLEWPEGVPSIHYGQPRWVQTRMDKKAADALGWSKYAQ